MKSEACHFKKISVEISLFIKLTTTPKFEDFLYLCCISIKFGELILQSHHHQHKQFDLIHKLVIEFLFFLQNKNVLSANHLCFWIIMTYKRMLKCNKVKNIKSQSWKGRFLSSSPYYSFIYLKFMMNINIIKSEKIRSGKFTTKVSNVWRKANRFIAYTQIYYKIDSVRLLYIQRSPYNIHTMF